MIALLSKKITSFFISNDILKIDDKEIYEYSFELLIATIANAVVILVLSIYTQSILESIFFCLGFIPIRLTAGGYHAKNHFRCILTLIFVYSLFILMIKTIPVNKYFLILVITSILSTLLIFIFSPVEDKNKPLSYTEKHKLKNKSRLLILMFVMISILVFLKTDLSCVAISIQIGNVIASLSLLASVIKNKIISLEND